MFTSLSIHLKEILSLIFALRTMKPTVQKAPKPESKLKKKSPTVFKPVS